MQGRIIFLLEEPSMKTLLEGLLPRLFEGWVKNTHFMCIAHEGKSDLDRSITRKLNGWRIPNDRFVILRDNDNADCFAIKAVISKQCKNTPHPDTLIRLVCQELEAWYLGDLNALSTAFSDSKLNKPANIKRFIDPDVIFKPSVELQRLIPSFQKGGGARLMSQHLSSGNNASKSYQHFLNGLQRLVANLD